MIDGLARIDRQTWLRAVPFSLGAALVIAFPTDLIDTPIFGRPVPPKPIDYAILAATASVIGLILAIRPSVTNQSDSSELSAGQVRSADPASSDTGTMFGGFITVLAVGCPVCNHMVVALIGTSGALSWWAPVQPLVGLLAVGVLLYTLRLRLRTVDLKVCPVPSA